MNGIKNNTISRRGLLGGFNGARRECVRGGATQGRQFGEGRRLYGDRSGFEKIVRSFGASTLAIPTGASRTPLQDLYGIITPSSLQRSRSGCRPNR